MVKLASKTVSQMIFGILLPASISSVSQHFIPYLSVQWNTTWSLFSCFKHPHFPQPSNILLTPSKRHKLSVFTANPMMLEKWMDPWHHLNIKVFAQSIFQERLTDICLSLWKLSVTGKKSHLCRFFHNLNPVI